ncbi:L-lactate dehydrogenase B chain [Dissostichus eleginoides]|uniref:L-lactate dehydrogenase B chain n=1 Tax=Dissostichus eleginoides TaxID=100907 RepID=A0AAD9CC47_DISEL|nr:L-lactate dehydrogenase B chain [Dissostichus eleginoides]
MWSPDVCVNGEGGHSSGQHQLSECEVQPQAKASLACGDKPDPPQKTVVWVGVGEDLAQKQTSLCCCSTTWAESLGTPSDATLPAWHSAAASGLNTTSLNPPPGRPGLPEPEAAYRCALVHLHASINYCSNFFLLIIIDK